MGSAKRLSQDIRDSATEPGFKRKGSDWFPHKKARTMPGFDCLVQHMIKLTETREIAPYVWVHPDEDR